MGAAAPGVQRRHGRAGSALRGRQIAAARLLQWTAHLRQPPVRLLLAAAPRTHATPCRRPMPTPAARASLPAVPPLAAPPPLCTHLPAAAQAMCAEELKKGIMGVDPALPSTITAFPPGYIDKEKEVIVGLQVGGRAAWGDRGWRSGARGRAWAACRRRQASPLRGSGLSFGRSRCSAAAVMPCTRLRRRPTSR